MGYDQATLLKPEANLDTFAGNPRASVVCVLHQFERPAPAGRSGILAGCFYPSSDAAGIIPG